MTQFDIIGYIGTFLIALALVPQVAKTFHTKSARDISLLWTVVFVTGLGIWIIYSFINLIWPAMIFSSIEFLLGCSMLVMKLLYK